MKEENVLTPKLTLTLFYFIRIARVTGLLRQRHTTKDSVRVSASVKEENVLTLKLTLTLFYFIRIARVTGSLRQRSTTGGSVSVEIECEGRKCPHTQTHTHTFLFYLNNDGHRIIAPEKHH